jgi:hypothetical protein
MDTRGGVRLVQQTSQTQCREGSNWGYDRDSVWVDRGCAGRFATRSGSGSGGHPRIWRALARTPPPSSRARAT